MITPLKEAELMVAVQTTDARESLRAMPPPGTLLKLYDMSVDFYFVLIIVKRDDGCGDIMGWRIDGPKEEADAHVAAVAKDITERAGRAPVPAPASVSKPRPGKPSTRNGCGDN